jgi:uncharacterized damage-inducible protein DinB
MQATELLVQQMDWAGRNISDNLNFIAEDKLNWKPAPEAKSALEIANHTISVIAYFTAALKGTEAGERAPVTTREAAQAAIAQSTTEYANAVRALSPQDLERKVMLPFGELPLLVAANLAVIDTVNHHGQITYIQTILGDTEDHLSL